MTTCEVRPHADEDSSDARGSLATQLERDETSVVVVVRVSRRMSSTDAVSVGCVGRRPAGEPRPVPRVSRLAAE